MQGKGSDRGLFETLTLALLVAGLVLATLLMLAIAWRLRAHAAAARELGVRLQDLQQQRKGTLELLDRWEARAEKLQTDIGAEERRRTQLAAEAREAASLREQEEAKRRAEEEARQRHTPAELMRQADGLIRERRFQEAYQRYTAVIQLDPTHARAFVNRALVLRSLQRPDEALADLDRAVVLDPRDGYVFQSRAAFLLERHRKERAADALADCERGLALGEGGGGNEALLRYYRANALKALGRTEEAKAEYRWVSDNVPNLRAIVTDVLRAIEAQEKSGQPAADPPPAPGE